MPNPYPRGLCATSAPPLWAHIPAETPHIDRLRSQAARSSLSRGGVERNDSRNATDADSIALGSPVGAVTLWVLPSRGHPMQPMRDAQLPKHDVSHMLFSTSLPADIHPPFRQVLDARDPMGTRCFHLERHIRKNLRHKHLILLLNKCDLVRFRSSLSPRRDLDPTPCIQTCACSAPMIIQLNSLRSPMTRQTQWNLIT